ncbi:MAG: putative manganese transporter [Marinobacterium sp.]|nr:putative manganese transporter [Marinobacterium sp.]
MNGFTSTTLRQRLLSQVRDIRTLAVLAALAGLLTLWIFNESLVGLVQPELLMLIVETLSDAYLAVSVFVALSLLLIYSLQHYLGADLIGYLNNHPRIQVPVAALLGMLPGCGGAIIVVTQFVHGKLSFGALVAVLISTMGDASFLLLATEPVTAVMVLSVSTIAGIIFGYGLDLYHGSDFMRPTPDQQRENSSIPGCRSNNSQMLPLLSWSWRLLLIPGLILGVLAAFQVDTDAVFGNWAQYHPATWLGFTGAIVSLLIWFTQPPGYSWATAGNPEDNTGQHLLEMVANETSFVSAWVITGFLSFELLIYFTGFDLQQLFSNLGVMTIMLAVLVGFIPGCGPQIITTSLYLQGLVPLSAQLANAISNDGDALFPALALAPKASLYATLYSAVPAVIVGYIAFAMGH